MRRSISPAHRPFMAVYIYSSTIIGVASADWHAEPFSSSNDNNNDNNNTRSNSNNDTSRDENEDSSSSLSVAAVIAILALVVGLIALVAHAAVQQRKVSRSQKPIIAIAVPVVSVATEATTDPATCGTSSSSSSTSLSDDGGYDDEDNDVIVMCSQQSEWGQNLSIPMAASEPLPPAPSSVSSTNGDTKETCCAEPNPA